MFLAPARRRSRTPPRPRRPDHLRLGLRLAAGVSPARAAAAERVAEAEVAALLRDPDFAGLVDQCRRLRDLPEEQRLARLESLAWDVLELALADGDMRAVLFVLAERRQGRSPARTLAKRVAAAERRAAQDPPPAAAEPPTGPQPRPAPSPRRPRRGPTARSVARGAAHLRRAVVAENALHAGVEAPAAPAPAPGRAPRPALRRVVDRSGCSTAMRLLVPAPVDGGRSARLALDGLAAYLAQAP